MTPEVRAAARQVLRDAAEKIPHLFDLSDAERLVAMLGLAFELGRQSRGACSTNIKPARQKASLSAGKR